MATGWCCYDQELGDAQHVAAVRRLEPPIVRWFCSVDRHVLSNSATSFPWEQRYGQAWQAIADCGATLVVQLQMKRPDWTAGDAGNVIGATQWRAGSRHGWPADPDAKWVPFVRTLRAALEPYDLPSVLWGAWNEPDWRIGWPWEKGPGGANPPASPVEYLSGQWLWWPAPPTPPFGWSGGQRRLADLRSRLPELTWTSDGVGAVSPDWLSMTAADPTVSVIDVHGYYGDRVADMVTHTSLVVEEFDLARPGTQLPIVIGEWGEDANGTPFSPDWLARTQQLADELDRLYPGRLLGICAHLQGTRQGVTYPALWQVL